MSRSRWRVLTSLLGQAGEAGDQEGGQDVAHQLVGVEVVAREAGELDVVVRLAELHHRQQVIEAVGEVSLLKTLSAKFGARCSGMR